MDYRFKLSREGADEKGCSELEVWGSLGWVAGSRAFELGVARSKMGTGWRMGAGRALALAVVDEKLAAVGGEMGYRDGGRATRPTGRLSCLAQEGELPPPERTQWDTSRDGQGPQDDGAKTGVSGCWKLDTGAGPWTMDRGPWTVGTPLYSTAQRLEPRAAV